MFKIVIIIEINDETICGVKVISTSILLLLVYVIPTNFTFRTTIVPKQNGHPY